MFIVFCVLPLYLFRICCSVFYHSGFRIPDLLFHVLHLAIPAFRILPQPSYPGKYPTFHIPHPQRPTCQTSYIPNIPHFKHPTSQTSHILKIPHPKEKDYSVAIIFIWLLQCNLNFMVHFGSW